MTTKRQEVEQDLAEARERLDEAGRDLAEVTEAEPAGPPVGPTNEEAAEAAAGSIQIGG